MVSQEASELMKLIAVFRKQGPNLRLTRSEDYLGDLEVCNF